MEIAFKCKMCGGDLDIIDDSTVYKCIYCGTKQTIPQMDNEKKIRMFNRANRLRFANEFDAAMGVFENVVAEFPDEAEAYWGLCLCKYGIEYVDDPDTKKKIPTCHRANYFSILDDNNYIQAYEKSDESAKQVYLNEAQEIDRIQKYILEIAKNEKPFDVFICYKETAEDGQRTNDSVYAQDIYDALTEKGYKVFFSRITLESKLGEAYEPFIFSALNTSKVMLVVGTDYEHFNAVWVKNEWSRFIKMLNDDKSKEIYICYADMDSDDMPREFNSLTKLNVKNVGFLQDLVRGIGKIVQIEKRDSQNIHQISGANIENLLKRGFFSLEDCKWEEAQKSFDKILSIDNECSKAYLGKAMVSYKASRVEALYRIKDLSNNTHFKNARQHAKGTEIAEYQRIARENANFFEVEIKRARIVEQERVAIASRLQRMQEAMQYTRSEFGRQRSALRRDPSRNRKKIVKAMQDLEEAYSRQSAEQSAEIYKIETSLICCCCGSIYQSVGNYCGKCGCTAFLPVRQAIMMNSDEFKKNVLSDDAIPQNHNFMTYMK